MSSASFSTSSSRKTERGFSQREVQSFLTMGDTLASRRANQGIATRPQERKRTTTTTTSEAGSIAKFFGARDEGTRVETSGFMGQFASGITAADLDSLRNTFLQRQRQIQQRRAQPGRSALFLARS